MLILKRSCCIIVSGRVPKAPARNSHSLILHLPDSNLNDELVARNVEGRLDLFFDFVGNVFGEGFEFIAKVGPFFYPLFVDLCVQIA
jgi:hypothetical protein